MTVTFSVKNNCDKSKRIAAVVHTVRVIYLGPKKVEIDQKMTKL